MGWGCFGGFWLTEPFGGKLSASFIELSKETPAFMQGRNWEQTFLNSSI